MEHADVFEKTIYFAGNYFVSGHALNFFPNKGLTIKR